MRQLQLERSVWSLDEAKMLGRPGGFGGVHPGTAEDGTPVAIKILRRDIGDAAHRELEFARAFVGRATQHVMPVLDFGQDAATGQSCIVMPRADMSLRDRLNTGAALQEADAIQVLVEIARGLLEVEDWVHRDLKPENVLRYRDRWQIADFGIARLADASTSLRTLKGALSPPYAAPEQWDGRRASHATDVYALGCIGAELLSGRPLYPGPAVDDYAEQHRRISPHITVGSPRIRSLLLRMVAKPAPARPDIEAVVAELTSIQARPNGSGPGAAALGEAAAAVADATARAEAAQAEAEAKRIQRVQLVAHALTEISSLAERLSAEIKEYAPQANIRWTGNSPGRSCEVELGSGRLIITMGHFANIPPDAFADCGWDVVCGDIIIVESPRYTRSASLWYTNLGGGSYGWVETAYWTLSGDSSKTPCYLPPGRDANFAAAHVMHSWNLAYPPRAIETEEQADAFCQRWMNFLGQAARGTLAHPGRMPEE
ncbi:MAG: serine/threonine protein kinase [Microbispora sp.]|nr:serine/threonine protein kinase [Microbispora sp.]